MIYRVFNLGGINLKVSPFLLKDGDLLRCTNLDTFSYGSKRKRPGYITYMGTANGSAPDSLFSWLKEDGTTLYTYRASGGLLYYSTQGTTAWTVCGGGTITAGTPVAHAVLANTLIVSQEGGTTMHTTSGTSFATTALAPAGRYMCSSRDNRVYIGSASTLFYSALGNGADWSGAGTSDSSSLTIPGPGAINSVFYANDRVVTSKRGGAVFTYDGYNLSRVPTNQGPTSNLSLAETEDYWFYLNRQGYFGYGGNRPKLISNPIENKVYNNAGSAIPGTVFDTAPGVTHRYQYYCAVGTNSDEVTEETITNAIHRYDYQLDEWSDYQFAHLPTAWHSYKDDAGNQQLIFGASGGQCYKVSGTATSDNGNPIQSVMEGVIHLGQPERDKKFDHIWAFASPGCQAVLQLAVADSFGKAKKKWQNMGDLRAGCVKYGFPGDNRGKLLFYRLSEYSTFSPFIFYGFAIEAEIMEGG